MLTAVSVEELGAQIVPADSLKTGDVMLKGIRIVGERDGFTVQEFVHVTVLRDKEQRTEHRAPLCGMPMLYFWCRREDNGAEGYVIFGLDGYAAKL